MIYVVEALCLTTNEVWYGCRTESFEQFVNRLRNPNVDALGRAIQKHGYNNFRFRLVMTYARQAPAIKQANQLITRAMQAGRSLNPRLLVLSNKRNAKR